MNIKINRYISNKKQELLDIIDKEGRILLVANPGTGKTYFATELMELQKKAGNRFIYATFLTAIPKQLNTDFKFDLVCSSYEKTWTDRMENFEPGDDLLEKDELVIGTTLHQLVRFAKDLTEDDVIVIDEAHQLVQLSHQPSINNLREELKNTTAKLLLMTGTPFEKDAERLNLSIVNILEEKPRVDKLIYIPVTSKMKEVTDIYDLTATIVHWYLYQDVDYDEYGEMLINADTKKILIYNNGSREKNEALLNTLNKAYDFRFDDINAKKKDSKGYKYLIDEQKIRDEFNGIVTTSVIKEGINLRNQDVDVIIVLGNLTLKDEKQISKRIREEKPLLVFRIYNEPDNNKIEEIEFEIDLVNFLHSSFKNRPDRLRKQLQRFANCGIVLKETGILDSNVQNIYEEKVEDILEHLNAQKCTLDEYIQRQTYNDLEAVDGSKYLEKEHNLFITDSTEYGELKDQLKTDAEDVRQQKVKNLKELILELFGDSSHFDVVIKFMKGDLISYSKTGKLLREIDSEKITDITNDGYVTDNFPEDKFGEMDDKERKEYLFEAVKKFSSEFGRESSAVIKILHFLTENATDVTDVLRLLNKKIPASKLVWTARRFMLSEKLNKIRIKTKHIPVKSKLLKLSVLKEKDNIFRFDIMSEVGEQLNKYGVVYMSLLRKTINKKYGASQYMKSLKLNTKEGLKLFVFALGAITDVTSWKLSSKNATQFNKLWKDYGKVGMPQARNSFRVLKLDLCNPTELINHYRDDL